MIEYDEGIILKMVGDLYAQARSLESGYTLMGLLLGGVLGWAGTAILADTAKGLDASPGCMGLAAGLACALAGYLMAKPKAFLLRLAAQQAMCMVQIERNTRR